MGKRSVSRFSSLRYILQIGADSISKKELTTDDVLQSIVKTRKEIELERIGHPFTRVSLSHAEQESYWKKKYIRRRADETYKILEKWNLIDENGRVTETLEKIGQAYNEYRLSGRENNLELAKKLLLNAILSCGKEEPFNPSRFLMKIRDCSLHELLIKGRIDQKEIVTKTIQVDEEGIAYATRTFINQVANTNPVTFEVLRDWGKFFELTNWFQVRLKGLTNFRVISPKFGIYLTRSVCTLRELLFAALFIKNEGPTSNEELSFHLSESLERKYNLYTIRSILYALDFLGLVTQQSGKYVFTGSTKINSVNLIEKTLKKDCLILSEGNRKGVIFKHNKDFSDIDENKVFLLFKPRINLKTFYKVMETTFSSLLVHATQHFVYIPVLREETCKALRVSDRVFDNLLTECAREYYEKIEFVRAPQRFGLKKEAKFGRPIILNEVPYYLIRIKV